MYKRKIVSIENKLIFGGWYYLSHYLHEHSDWIYEDSMAAKHGYSTPAIFIVGNEEAVPGTMIKAKHRRRKYLPRWVCEKGK